MRKRMDKKSNLQIWNFYSFKLRENFGDKQNYKKKKNR